MTKPRTLEEIADEAMLNSVRATDNMQWCNSVKTVILAALREAADAARHEEREALREKLKNSRPPVEQAGSMTPFESGWRNACASNIHWLDARSRSEEPRPGGLNSPTG